MNAMRAFFAKFQKDQRGVTAIEYGLIAIAMAALLTAVFAKDGSVINNLKGTYDKIGSTLQSNSATYTKQSDGSYK